VSTRKRTAWSLKQVLHERITKRISTSPAEASLDSTRSSKDGPELSSPGESKPDSKLTDRRTKPGRRTEIAEAALRLMAEHGLAGATNSRIGSAVGLSAPALYAHFENRQELLTSAMDLLIERIKQWYSQSSNPDVSERLRELGECHASYMAQEVDGFVLPSFEFIVSPPATGLAHRFGALQRQSYEVLIRIVDEGKAQGSIRPDVDSRVVAWSLVVFAWAEDVARLAGLDEFIEDGISLQILQILLDQATVANPGQVGGKPDASG